VLVTLPVRRYESWEEGRKDRYRVTGKTVYSGIVDEDRFRKGSSLAEFWRFNLMVVRDSHLPAVDGYSQARIL
jgi:Ni/Co efflux regulator RcnB